MRLIGLTGGIATGKSTVAQWLAGQGAAIVDADLVAREVVAPGSDGHAEVVRQFGAGVLTGAGAIDRGVLGGRIFADPGARRQLEAITHPRILALLAERTAVALAGPAPLVAVDIPLLFEQHHQDLVEGVLLVYAAPATQLLRLRRRDGYTTGEAERRIAAQLPIGEKRKLATWVIDNDGARAETEAALQRWWLTNIDPASAVPG